jgi:DnaK suppressor protein
MSNLDLQVIQKVLENEQEMLVNEIQNEKDKLDIYIEVNPDPFDLVDKRLHQEIVLNRLGYMERRLRQVRATLKRLEGRVYGICEKCDKAINPERLKAIPYATRCVNCQEQLEHVG